MPRGPRPRTSTSVRSAIPLLVRIGGAGGGTLLTALLPILQGAAGNVDIGTVLGQAVGGGIAGAVVTAIVGIIKNMMAGQAAK